MTMQEHNEEVRFQIGEVTLAGTLGIPEHALGMVLFAHGSGSSRHSPRNRFVAGTYGRAAFWSSDGGVDWSRMELDVEDVRTVVFSDCQPRTVFAICSEGRLLYSDVRKVNWRVVECDAMVQCLDFVEQD